ncbi:2OG-Fe(II) oxygenase [Pseudomonas sp. 10B1]|uniref:2OG-Fe(II) oxygenase n=1 Tax=unclassified Pseudomonas TaxID=196821 RepID=UPI002AB3A83E|nr:MULTISPECIES: 2OG-Fe(II) oxygenase [unclassified Pseudomonas]MDY7562377.1 2OG-Fe(II) oxygenase [Pseudomonas sp. AB6]MEA9994699.1 2OG-Fe(II) oxygenase [Pseudomonas sp. AA4]MEB0086362.1 2OG-Fe(II) oxygenase [Pseudomonas sp. RTI1]MEB0126439.1 2OG-Fe(II) oxygenase [Pseudomonas sp. CCC1.2]MEB0155889.1 2OG-Fe(II) oxygenase [Pseudomonas sp. CCC4.3]
MLELAMETRLDSEKWSEHLHRVNDHGFTVIKALLPPDSCRRLIDFYPQDHRFRSCINMKRHGFGSGEYKYFAYPLPQPVATLRSSFYTRLVPLANYWNEKLGIENRYPESHEVFVSQCHRANQTRPTPLLLRYGVGDYNCLHRDLYGDTLFPVQMTILLSKPNDDFSGGEFVITEQRPRMQSRASVVPLDIGDAVIFSVNRRPVKGTRGFYSVFARHGVSEILTGNRFTLGVIFHDAQ